MLIQAQHQTSAYNETKTFHSTNNTDINMDSNDGNGSSAADKPSDSNDEDSNNYSVDDINIDPRTYCKLGHFHLLLEDYPKGRHTQKHLNK